MAEISVTDITTGYDQGTGVFDLLLASEKTRLDQQWELNRIRGSDYSKVYLGSLEAIMQQTIIFLLGRQEADKKAEAIDKDIEKSEAEIALILQQIETEKCNTTLVCNQAAKVLVDTDLVSQEILNAIEEVKLTAAQTAKTLKETDLLDEQILLAQAEVALKEQQLDIQEQELLIKQQELELAKARLWVEMAKISDDPSITEAPSTITGLMGEEIAKMDAEGNLVNQRVVSERSQTEDFTTGVLGKQTNVLIKQAEGFDRDAEQKGSKLMVDAFNVMKSADENIPVPDGLHMYEITKVLDTMKEGLGLDPAPDYCPRNVPVTDPCEE